MKEKGPCLTLYSPGGRVTSRFEERVLVGYVSEFSTQYSSTVVLALHTIRCRVAQDK
jgi:hypothetical protein